MAGKYRGGTNVSSCSYIAADFPAECNVNRFFLLWRPPNYTSMYCILTLIDKTKLFNLCFKPPLFTIITPPLHCYSYKKDERATPGNSPPSSPRKIVSHFSHHSPFRLLSYSFCVSLSLSVLLSPLPSIWLGGSVYVRNVQWPAFSMKISLDFSRHWRQCSADTKVPR